MRGYQISHEELKEEAETIAEFESEKLATHSDAAKELKIAKVAAENFLSENEILVDINIEAKDLTAIKRLATKRDMPYKKLVSEILHDYASGHLKKAI